MLSVSDVEMYLALSFSLSSKLYVKWSAASAWLLNSE